MNKTIAWQFTETGVAGSGINIKVDVNIIKNEFFSRFINKK
jgi:GH25 family lysozyme M1 (1,4-beta-N-acetylmuramidase)